jgi:LacI family transcriptional regulator
MERMAIQKSSAPTIIDVAELAGVSRATASRAMGNYGRIAAHTVEQVRKAAAELGYRPNEVARAMRQGRTKTIGLVIIADFTNAFFDRATKAIVDAAKSRGYQVLITNTDEDIAAERQAIETLVDKQVDGLIVVPSTAAVHDHLIKIQQSGKPMVLLDRRLEGIIATSVTTDDFSGAEEAVRHAHALGHRRIGFLVAAAGNYGHSPERPALLISSVEDRVNGFLSASADLGIKGRQQSWRFCEDNPKDPEAAVAELLDQSKAPSVIIASNNDMALAVLKVAGNRKLAIGKDISLITFDDSQWAEAMAPGLTVVARPVERVGLIAVEKLLAEIDQPGQPSEKIVLPTELIARGSVANLVMYPENEPESY